jgi:hypothetical protein
VVLAVVLALAGMSAALYGVLIWAAFATAGD